MAFDTAYPQVLANLAAGNEPVAILDSNFTPLYNALLSLNTFGNYYVDSGAANAYVVTITARQSVTLAAGLPVQFQASNANTGASTLNVGGTGAKNILNLNGSALQRGQIAANSIVSVMYDGTQYLLLGAVGSTFIGTAVAATSGTSIDFTGIPAGVRRITINLFGVSTNGTNPLLIQLGDSGGIEASGYLGAGSDFTTIVVTGRRTDGFVIGTAFSAAAVAHGSIYLTQEAVATFSWCATGTLGWSNADVTQNTAGHKSTSAELDRVRITTVNGVDTFDAGEINIAYSF